MSSELTAAERVDLLEQLEKEDANRRRQTVFAAWGSVGLATIVLAILVFGAGLQLTNLRAKQNNAAKQLEGLRRETKDTQEELDKKKAELKVTEETLAYNKDLLEIAYKAQGRNAFEEKVATNKETGKLPPRAYLQIVDPQDRSWATTMRSRLEASGFIVPGIELVRTAKLKSTEVRYYKEGERGGAEEIVKLLKAAGVDAVLVALNQENNQTVRPNHFEVWFVAGSRNIK
jgi:hypothetical protein